MTFRLSNPLLIALAALCAFFCLVLAPDIVRAQPVTTPAAPAIDSLTPFNGASTVAWSAPADDGASAITSYDLRYIRGDTLDTNWTVRDSVWTSGELSYTITGLDASARYEVQIRAVNPAGNGPWSAAATIASVPDRPTVYSVTFWDGSIFFLWNSPGDDGGSAITGYGLRYIRSDWDDTVDANWTLLEGMIAIGGDYVIKGLTNGTTYHVQVRVVNAEGAGPWSERVTRTPAVPPPSVPGPLRVWGVSTSDSSIFFPWDAPGNDGGSAITGYDLRYIRSDRNYRVDANWTLMEGVSKVAFAYNLTGLTNGITYHFQMRAANAERAGRWSPRVTVTPGPVPPSVPDRPTVFSVFVTTGLIEILWHGLHGNRTGGSAITHYDLRYIRGDRDDTVDANWTLLEGATRTRAYEITGLTNGITYHVQVRAVNAVGPGAWSERVTRTPALPPSLPTIESATPGDGSITITWSPPEDDGGSTITYYTLRYIPFHEIRPKCRWTYVWGISPGDLTYTISGLQNGVRYAMRMRAGNSSDSGEWSGPDTPYTAKAGVEPAQPASPVSVSVTPGDGSLTVACSAPEAKEGVTITGYQVSHILSDESGSWTTSPVIPSSGTLQFVISGLTNGTFYWVRVKSISSDGVHSDYYQTLSSPGRPPSAVTGLRTRRFGETGISVGFRAPND